jgi:hypothetical protein
MKTRNIIAAVGMTALMTTPAVFAADWHDRVLGNSHPEVVATTAGGGSYEANGLEAFLGNGATPQVTQFGARAAIRGGDMEFAHPAYGMTEYLNR